MNSFSAETLDDLLAKLAQANAVAGNLGIFFGDAEDVVLDRIRVHAEDQIRRGQVEEAEGVRLQNLGESEDAAQFIGGGRNPNGEQLVASLGGGDEMADRTNAADPGHERWHLVKWAAFAELFEAAKLRDVEAGFVDSSLIVEVQRDFGMALDAGNRVDENGFAGGGALRCVVRDVDRVGQSYAPNLVLELSSGVRPSSNSLST